jgi:capsular polysaccharide biosynthesis protein
MELKSAAKRILWHAKLIVLFIAIGVAIPLALLSRPGPAVASTRILLDGVTDTDHAASAADVVTGIATSETELGVVLGEYPNIHESVTSLAKRISASPIGSSGIVQIQVSDPSPEIAARLAEAISLRVISVIRDRGISSSPLLPVMVQDANAATAKPLPTKLPQMMILGALAGLILGLFVAALIETFSATVVGREAIAEELAAPVLEVLPRPPGVGRPSNLSWLRWQLAARARSSRVSEVELAGVGRRVDILALAEGLDMPGDDGADSSGLLVRPLDVDSPGVGPNRQAGLVIVLPRVVKLREIQRAKNLAQVTGWPLIGVVAYEPSHRGAFRPLFGSTRERAATKAAPKMKQVA